MASQDNIEVNFAPPYPNYQDIREMIRERLYNGWVFINSNQFELLDELRGYLFCSSVEKEEPFILSCLNIPGKDDCVYGPIACMFVNLMHLS